MRRRTPTPGPRGVIHLRQPCGSLDARDQVVAGVARHQQIGEPRRVGDDHHEPRAGEPVGEILDVCVVAAGAVRTCEENDRRPRAPPRGMHDERRGACEVHAVTRDGLLGHRMDERLGHRHVQELREEDGRTELGADPAPPDQRRSEEQHQEDEQRTSHDSHRMAA